MSFSNYSVNAPVVVNVYAYIPLLLSYRSPVCGLTGRLCTLLASQLFAARSPLSLWYGCGGGCGSVGWASCPVTEGLVIRNLAQTVHMSKCLDTEPYFAPSGPGSALHGSSVSEWVNVCALWRALGAIKVYKCSLFTIYQLSIQLLTVYSFISSILFTSGLLLWRCHFRRITSENKSNPSGVKLIHCCWGLKSFVPV